MSMDSMMEYCAVFDGHRGKALSNYAASSLHHAILAELRASATSAMDMPGLLERAFHACNEGARQEGLRDGSTACVLLRLNGGDQLWCANVGNSRAVIGAPGGEIRRLSFDHTPAVPEELARITAAGGEVEFGYLDGILEISR